MENARALKYLLFSVTILAGVKEDEVEASLPSKRRCLFGFAIIERRWL